MKPVFERIRAVNLVPWLLIFYSVGVAGLIIPLTREIFQAVIPLTLLLNFLLLMVYHHRPDRGFAWKAIVIFSAGFLVEVLGVNTGSVFGSYEYGNSLGPKILHTPLIIGVNWLMLVYGSLVIVSRFADSRYVRVLLAAVLMVVYDFVLEPAAINFDMWNWGGPVPMQNYAAWLLVSIILVYFADRTRFIDRNNKIAAPLFFIQFIFFVLLDIFMLILKIWG